MDHIQINELPYRKQAIKWLLERYGKEEALRIWKKTRKTYNSWLIDLPDYGGKKNGHANAIYGGLLIFALYPALPDDLEDDTESRYDFSVWGIRRR